MVDKPVFTLGKEIPNNVPPDPTLGLFICVGPVKPIGLETDSNHITELNFTGQPGTAAAIYYALVYQLPRWGFFVTKPDEWIEVSPTHKEYYERTMATKQTLEGVIKTGLATAASAVSDYELMSHDLRKYKEILDYFASKDEHSLKSMFIDQVDLHTGAMSMVQMVQRWPTLIADFHRLSDEDVEPEKIAKKLDLSKAEAVILVTKNKLYLEWKKLFSEAAKERYSLIKGLVEGRKKSIKEYKEWLKPYIARFKMTKIGGERPELRASTLKSFADITGIATFANGVRLWAWKPFKPVEPRRPAAEIVQDFVIHPYDSYVRENFILDRKKGLASIYPWLDNDRKYCSSCEKYFLSNVVRCDSCGSIFLEDRKVADEIVEKQILPAWKNREMFLDPSELYYVFIDTNIMRVGSRLVIGEIEDITFTVNSFTVSQNVLLVKILEMKCREMELEKYIDEMLGLKIEEKEIFEIVSEEYPQLYKKSEKISELGRFISEFKDVMKYYRDFFKKIKIPKIGLMLFKPGPYEKDFAERITKHYLAAEASYFTAIVDFIKSKMGVP